MSQTLPYYDFEWLSKEQLREAEQAVMSDDWLVTVRLLDWRARYAQVMRRVLLANANGDHVPAAQTDIKMETAYIFEYISNTQGSPRLRR